MCQAIYFRNACSKQDLVTVLEYINANIHFQDDWSIVPIWESLPVSSFVFVRHSFMASAGTYIIVRIQREVDAIDLAGKVKSGSMVLPNRYESAFYFVMRID